METLKQEIKTTKTKLKHLKKTLRQQRKQEFVDGLHQLKYICQNMAERDKTGTMIGLSAAGLATLVFPATVGIYSCQQNHARQVQAEVVVEQPAPAVEPVPENPEIEFSL